MPKYITLLILILVAITGKSQTGDENGIDHPLITAGFEAGIITMTTEMNETSFIRGDVSAYQGYGGYNGYAPSSTVFSSTLRSFFGLKAEFSPRNKIFVSSGLRLIMNESSSGEKSKNPGNSPYFYWLWKNDGLNTHYLRVKDYTQNTQYLGIPVELKLNLAEMKCCRLYIKAGAEFNFLLKNTIDLTFYDETMEVHEKDLVSMVDDPKSFNAGAYAAFGFTFGKKYIVNLEVLLPFGMLYSETDALLSPVIGTGFKVDLMIPLKYKNNE